MPSEKVPGKPTSKDSGNSKHHQNSSSDSSTREWIKVTPDSAIGGPIVDFVKGLKEKAQGTNLESMEVLYMSADKHVDQKQYYRPGLSTSYGGTHCGNYSSTEDYGQYNKISFHNETRLGDIAAQGGSIIDFNDAFWRCENELEQNAKVLGDEEGRIMRELFGGLRKKYRK